MIQRILASFAVLLFASLTFGQDVYWSDIEQGEIRRKSLAGSKVQFLVGSPRPTGFVIDKKRNAIYWLDATLKQLRRASLKGTQIAVLLDKGIEAPRGLALDSTGMATGRVPKLYWLDESGSANRCSLDGSQHEVIIKGMRAPRHLALDVNGGKMYWTHDRETSIWRANLDGSVRELLVDRPVKEARGLSLDLTRRLIFWTDTEPYRIMQANLDGSNVSAVISEGVDDPRGIAVDPSAVKLYWASGGRNSILRANLNGSNFQPLVEKLPQPEGIAITRGDLPPPKNKLRIVVDVDGSDRLLINAKGAFWKHRHWSWPNHVSLNGVSWRPHKKNSIMHKDKTRFLPEGVNFAKARMKLHEGRDTAVLERIQNAMIIHFADTPNGRDTYDMTIEF
ncbi:MAG: hypothetical protein CMJ78_03840 [Planctomycetaceae bacterium]|nr:hypothetical protein [Planctomycetaceae bacterium]